MPHRPFLLAFVALALLLGCPDDQADDPVLASCGDGVPEGDEACDDGNAWGGDGCTPLCTVEDGTLEQEPNDSPEEGEAIEAGIVHGALPPGDRDCFVLSVPEVGAVRAELLPLLGTDCSDGVVVELLDADGLRISAGLPSAPTGCSSIDPDLDTWARYLAGGDYTICLEAPFDDSVPAYALALDVLDSCSDLPALTPDPRQDLEGDGLADACDPDDDNDGVDDEDDNCPAAPNGPDLPFPWDTSDQGFVNLWLVLGGFDEGVSPGGCEPSGESFAGPEDADVEAALGESVDGLPWFAHHNSPGSSAVLNFASWFTVEAPREAYAFTWIRSDGARDAQLTLGSDDGHRAWLNGVEVGMDAGCHGVGIDAFRYPVELESGWNRLLVKVHDGGGAWGLVARFYEADGETPLTDLELSIGGPTPWQDDQGDADGDGIGDFCDREP